MSFVHPKHAFMPCWIAVKYVARVLHFSASSFLYVINEVLILLSCPQICTVAICVCQYILTMYLVTIHFEEFDTNIHAVCDCVDGHT